MDNPLGCDLLFLYDDLLQKLKTLLTDDTRSHNKEGQRYFRRWFDKECLEAKRTLVSVFYAYKIASGLHHNLLALKKSNKQIVVQKKKEYRETTWASLIHSAKEKDSTTFAKIISKHSLKDSFRLDSLIMADTWKVYFRKIYADVPPDSPLQLIEELPEWFPVSIK